MPRFYIYLQFLHFEVALAAHRLDGAPSKTPLPKWDVPFTPNVGAQQCEAVRKGKRCPRAAILGNTLCSNHAHTWLRCHRVKRTPEEAAELAEARRKYLFRSPRLDEVFRKHVEDTDRYELDEELGLVRTCLESIINKVDAKADLSSLTPEHVAVLVEMSKTVSGIVENIAKVKNYFSAMITVEQFTVVLELISQLAAKFIPVEKQEFFIDELMKLPWPGVKTREEGRRWAALSTHPQDEGAFIEANRALRAAETARHIEVAEQRAAGILPPKDTTSRMGALSHARFDIPGDHWLNSVREKESEDPK